uniref:HSF-type DNA-binding domain-containing protein n=1 Tax=Ananas comosus var. bracteatus TaxID=296719 RepID=A0A6V7Q0V3_ANACO|nr:unnamed protein product [Ananas comosus var. bracteatus]
MQHLPDLKLREHDDGGSRPQKPRGECRSSSNPTGSPLLLLLHHHHCRRRDLLLFLYTVMDGGGGGGGGGPAPFLIKTYEMVDDAATDDIVSWSPTETSFVVWNPPEFAARLLPTYFKHNNFSSFIRQLNTYGFHKIDPERWEFANDYFIKGQKHQLKNIHRRKPIHSHSHPPGSLADSERAALEEEIERLTREKASLHNDLWRFKQQQSGAKIQIEDLDRRLLDMEQRQLKLIAFVQRAMRNPKFRDNLIKMAGASLLADSVDAIHKKRRLPGVEVTENSSFYDDHSSTSKPDANNLFQQDFCDKLQLGLCSAMTVASTQCSDDDNVSKNPECGRAVECLSDTGASFCSSKNVLVPRQIDEGLFPCHLNLTLASSSMQIDRNQYSNRTQSTEEQEPGNSTELNLASTSRDDGLRKLVGNSSSTGGDSHANVTSLKEGAPVSNELPAAQPARVNDVFWEQFLTERPGSSDTEEASSSLRANPSGEHQEDRKQGSEDMK